MPPTRADAPPADPEVVALVKRASPRRRWGWILGGLGLVAVVVAALVLGRGGEAPRWTTAEVTRGSLVRTVTAVGQLEPVESVQVGSDLSGRIASVAVEVNQEVKSGQELARLERAPFENAVAQARAQLEAAKASLRQAEVAARAATLDAERAERLLASGVATTGEVEDARAARDEAIAAATSARASVRLRQAALEAAEDDLADTVITSPIDGVVIVRLVDPGQTVVSTMSATSLFTVASSLRDLKAEVGVDEADVGQVLAGQPARFTVSAWPDRVFEATVRTVDLAPQTAAEVVTYDAELRVNNDDLALRPGMTATAEIEVGRLDDVLLVPTSALRWDPPPQRGGPPAALGGDEDTVWVLDGEAPREVELTLLGSNATSTAVEGDGVQAGDLVVIGVEEAP